MFNFKHLFFEDVLDWKLPPKVIAAFKKLGSDQRAAPEAAMLKVHYAMAGGVLNPVVEHIGDLTNRLTPHHPFNWAVSESLEKINRGLRALRHPYGFSREFKENCRNNAQYKKTAYDEFMARLAAALRTYATEHSKLTVYNRVQWLAREAAVALGEMDWKRAELYLENLKKILEKEPEQVLAYSLDAAGAPQVFR